MRILVCGGREYSDYFWVQHYLDHYSPTVIITGCARGADALGIRYAHENEIKLEGYPADWTSHGKAAGPIRNQQMLDDGKPDLVVAFPGSNGTADMVRRAKKHNLKVIEVSNEHSPI